MAASTQKAIFFDLVGTCCDWLSSLLPALQLCPPHPSLHPANTKLRELAIAWRQGFFEEIHARFNRGAPAEDIDVTHRRVLDRLLKERGIGLDFWDAAVRDQLVHQWHLQKPWADVIPALHQLRMDQKCFLIVLANGTTRLQLDIAQSSAIPFHMLLSSELLGLTKPDPAMYRKAMELARLPPEDCYMLASHLYDLEAAKAVGMSTIYIHRSTEDVGVEIELHDKHGYVDRYFDGREDRLSDSKSGLIAAAGQLIEDWTSVEPVADESLLDDFEAYESILAQLGDHSL
ncbi:HAD-like protein [Trematosphaeria pertusa]|uniref:HAD-like protein n=1 Tax=Trematosphaeria pertusa TaxID=390896 RepID=A0A6A6I8Z2_9PLEO|nr:HAD-like protein [Trematosphaeria pertusa]KAF2246412.1 HAD-like protein [Trematosphaeria pertusa]